MRDWAHVRVPMIGNTGHWINTILGWYAGKGAAVWALTPGTSSGALHSRFPWRNAHKAAPSPTTYDACACD